MKKIIIFTQFAKMADILYRELKDDYKTVVIQGSTPQEERMAAVKSINEGEAQILINTSAGSLGLNIQGASIIIHFDQEWSLAKMEQRVGRAHRMGQKEKVQVFSLLAKGTIDYYIAKILRSKGQLAEQVLGDIPIGMDTIKEILEYE